MTTIAYKNGIMAADRRILSGRNTIVAPADKILKREGRLIAVAGAQDALWALVDWLENLSLDGDPKTPTCTGMGEATGLVVEPNGAVFLVSDGRKYKIPSEPIALGSGCDHAFTAMDMGADPKMAVEMAILRDPFSGDGVTVLTLKD